MRKLAPLALLLAFVGCKKAEKISTNTPPQQVQQQPNVNQPNVNQPNVHAPTGVVVNPGPVAGGGGGGGAAQAVRKVVARAATQNDMHQLHLYIDSASSATGQMPTRQQLAADLQKGAPKLYKLWEEGSIAVTNLRQRESIWAYSVQAVGSGGTHLVITNSGVDTMQTEALKQRLKAQGD